MYLGRKRDFFPRSGCQMDKWHDYSGCVSPFLQSLFYRARNMAFFKKWNDLTEFLTNNSRSSPFESESGEIFTFLVKHGVWWYILSLLPTIRWTSATYVQLKWGKNINEELELCNHWRQRNWRATVKHYCMVFLSFFRFYFAKPTLRTKLIEGCKIKRCGYIWRALHLAVKK